MNGYGSHTFKWVNKDGDDHFVKYHFKTNQGIRTMTAEESMNFTQENPNFSQIDLYDNIAAGNHPSWTVYV